MGALSLKLLVQVWLILNNWLAGVHPCKWTHFICWPETNTAHTSITLMVLLWIDGVSSAPFEMLNEAEMSICLLHRRPWASVVNVQLSPLEN